MVLSPIIAEPRIEYLGNHIFCHMEHIIWTISFEPYHMNHIIWTIMVRPYHLDHYGPTISYGPYHMDHIICAISYVPYHMDHIICTISYGPYHMDNIHNVILTMILFIKRLSSFFSCLLCNGSWYRGLYTDIFSLGTVLSIIVLIW